MHQAREKAELVAAAVEQQLWVVENALQPEVARRAQQDAAANWVSLEQAQAQHKRLEGVEGVAMEEALQARVAAAMAEVCGV